MHAATERRGVLLTSALNSVTFLLKKNPGVVVLISFMEDYLGYGHEKKNQKKKFFSSCTLRKKFNLKNCVKTLRIKMKWGRFLLSGTSRKKFCERSRNRSIFWTSFLMHNECVEVGNMGLSVVVCSVASIHTTERLKPSIQPLMATPDGLSLYESFCHSVLGLLLQ